jgi:Na+/H+ antiporter NhaD/arsenite permease-like protein
MSMTDASFFSIPEDQQPATGEVSTPDNNNTGLAPSTRSRQASLTERIVRRKQISFDVRNPQQMDFFDLPIQEIDVDQKGEGFQDDIVQDQPPKLFFPLVFSPRVAPKPSGGGGHGGASETDEESVDMIKGGDKGIQYKIPPDDFVIRAGRKDKIMTAILFLIMAAFTGVCVGWKTHENEDHMLFGTVGTACVTPCSGDSDYSNFFVAHHDHFSKGDVITLVAHVDPKPNAEYTSSNAVVDIVRLDKDQYGSVVQTVVHTETFGPPDSYVRETFKGKVTVDWDNPDYHHIINISSSNGYPMSLTLAAQKQTPLTQNSILVAALIMVLVYIFILLELIHRTLVAIYGSMVALFFFFIMHGGEVESIKTIMLHQEWSTLGLLFGMMLIVGELSHTGIFEWLAVRLLVSSKGSFNRLLVLLCLLTAVASAFLDNVTTMLLLAPVTIDMCNILDVDPRPYLISEVILSNVGGTATLIGDPPNIIIGSSFSEVGFVDFIIYIMPCIMVAAVPISLLLVLWIYKPYLTFKKMATLDADKLKAAYPIYDEPRLMIAGTTTFFVILLFFLHPLHHKDTAWIALIGAFLTISFTNPHDVQDALRNHVEWDTLLFFAGLFVLVEVCAAMGLLEAIGGVLADVIKAQDVDQQLPIAITLLLWVSAVTSAFLDNIPYTATMIPVIRILADELPETLPIRTLIWALSFGACLGGNGTLLGASANIVTAGIASSKGYNISFMNFFYPGMVAMIVTTAIANLYMLVVFVWV